MPGEWLCSLTILFIMKKIIGFWLHLIWVAILISCNSNSQSAHTSDNTQSLEGIKYAKGFNVQVKDGYKLVEVKDPSASTDMLYKYAFVNTDSVINNIPAGYTIIKTPVEKVICMTTLQLSGFIKLDAIDKIVGITSTRFIKNSKVNDALESGMIHKIGIEGEFDSEVIYSIDPDVILISPFKRGGYDALENMDIPMICYLGYKEASPLGQAEWIKFVGMLTGMEDEAVEIFNEIEHEYNKLKEITTDVSYRPKILSGELHSGNWYVVGGNSYLAQIFRDAGGEYFMVNDNESGGYYLDYETVYAQGHDCDFWRIANSHKGAYSYDILKSADSRYQDFKPYRDKKVIYCNIRDKPFYENTPMEPHVVLADLINVFHPGLLDNHQAVYYDLLDE